MKYFQKLKESGKLVGVLSAKQLRLPALAGSQHQPKLNYYLKQNMRRNHMPKKPHSILLARVPALTYNLITFSWTRFLYIQFQGH